MADTVQTWKGQRFRTDARRRPKGAACSCSCGGARPSPCLMCMPLILIIACLIIYPAFYSIYLSMLNKAQTRFIGLSNFTFLMSRDTFWMVVAAIGDLRAIGGVLQSADRPDHRASGQQPAGQGPAQMARHAAGAVGDPAGAVDARLVVDVRSHQFGVQLHAEEPGLRLDPLAERSLLGALFGDPGQRLVRRAVLPDHVSGRAEIGARAAL